MPTQLKMNVDQNVLSLNGILDCQSVPLAWTANNSLDEQYSVIDVTNLTRVDSAGLSFLTYLCIEHKATLRSVSQQLNTLIELYDLKPIVL